jgi:hypothetical protein
MSARSSFLPLSNFRRETYYSGIVYRLGVALDALVRSQSPQPSRRSQAGDEQPAIYRNSDHQSSPTRRPMRWGSRKKVRPEPRHGDHHIAKNADQHQHLFLLRIRPDEPVRRHKSQLPYSRGLLSGFAVQFVSGTSIETVTYFFNRKGELKETQTSIREMGDGLLRGPKKE